MNKQPDQICHTIVDWLNKPEPQNPDWSAGDWEDFKRVSRVHGVAPLLHLRLKQISWVNANIRNWLTDQYHFNRQRIARMHAELVEILALFAAHNIPVIPLKGPTVSVKFYEDLACRPMADLDLLIHPQDFGAVAPLLTRLGYRRDVAHWKHIGFVKPDNRQVVSIDCEHPDNPRKLEIHLHCRETFGGPTIDLTNLIWTHSSRQELLAQPAILPEPGMLWLHLLIHATYHLWQGKGRLIHLVDLVKIRNAVAGRDRLSTLEFCNLINARFTCPALATLNTYFPDTAVESLLPPQRAKLSPAFRKWADSLDLVNTSHLNPDRPGLYLPKALRFTEGRPHEVAQALRFALLPSLEELALDHPRLAKSRVPWLAYFLLPMDWLKRLLQRTD